MLDTESASNINVATFATTLVLKTSAAHWDQGVEAEILRVKDVTDVGRCGWHTAWVAVDDLHDAEIGIIEVDRKRDCLAGRVLIDMVGNASTRRLSAGEAADNLAKSRVGNERQAVHFAILTEDRTQHGVEGRFGNSGGKDRTGRGAIVSRNSVGGLGGGLNPLAKAAHTVRSASTVFDSHFVVGSDSSLNVTLDFTHRLCFSLSNIGRTNAGNSLLQVRHEVIAAHQLDVVTQTSAISKLVAERGNVGTFGDTSRNWGCEGINGPLGERRSGLALGAKRQDWGFFWSKDSKFVAEILTVGDCGTLASLGLGRIWLIGSTNWHDI